MAPALTRRITWAATLVLVASLVFTAAVGAWSVSGGCLVCGLGVGVGWVVVRHEPTSPVGPALAWTTAAIAAISAHVGPLAALPWSSGAWPLNLAGFLALLLVFPDGALSGWQWRAIPWAFALATVGMIAAQWGATQRDGAVIGGPRGVWPAPVAITSMLTIGACLALAVAALVRRYHRGDRRTRQQIGCLAVAGIIVVLLLVAGWVAEAWGASLNVAYTPFLLAITLLLPAAVGVAIVRYGLFDIDRLLSGTAAWTVTIAVSAGLFALVVFLVGQVHALETELGRAIAAFVTALVLLPLHRYLASGVGRVVDRDRHLAVATMERFAADVRAGHRQPEEVELVLKAVQEDPGLVVQVASPDGGWILLDGSPVADPAGFALEAGGDVIARVALSRDSARARRRLAEVAKIAWVPIEVSRLRLGLRRALSEAEASRGRLVEATSAERRRLERDLHDGVQQRVLATGMRLRLLQGRLPVSHAAEVDAAVAELSGTVEELRRIAHGIRPSQLDDGLAAALEAIRAASPIPIEVDAAGLPEVSEVRALTTYLVVSEAVANALKHACASQIRVTLGAEHDRLTIRVSDDGQGGVPEDAPLAALRDRVSSVGGSLGVRSAPGTGTTITAMI